MTPPKPTFVYLLVSYLLVFPFFRFFFRGRTIGKEKVPKFGSLVVVANHGSHLDPPLIGHALGRPVSFMAKAELFRIPLLGQIIRMCGACAALLAARSKSYLLPVAIINSHRALGIRSIFPRLVPIHLRIGNPIPPPTSRKKFELENKTEQLKRSINSMLDQGINA